MQLHWFWTSTPPPLNYIWNKHRVFGTICSWKQVHKWQTLSAGTWPSAHSVPLWVWQRRLVACWGHQVSDCQLGRLPRFTFLLLKITKWEKQNWDTSYEADPNGLRGSSLWEFTENEGVCSFIHSTSVGGGRTAPVWISTWPGICGTLFNLPKPQFLICKHGLTVTPFS